MIPDFLQNRNKLQSELLKKTILFTLYAQLNFITLEFSPKEREVFRLYARPVIMPTIHYDATAMDWTMWKID